jgi:hypothetical protein
MYQRIASLKDFMDLKCVNERRIKQRSLKTLFLRLAVAAPFLIGITSTSTLLWKPNTNDVLSQLENIRK